MVSAAYRLHADDQQNSCSVHDGYARNAVVPLLGEPFSAAQKALHLDFVARYLDGNAQGTHLSQRAFAVI